MSRRKAAAGGNGGRIVGVVLLIALLAGGVYLWQRGRPIVANAPVHAPPSATQPAAADADRVDPANEGRAVIVSGRLVGGRRVRDAELGIEADGLALLRRVEMRQWQERCTGSACDYALVWSEQPIDSHAFRTAAGHENPPKFPFASRTFVSTDVRLGAFHVDRGLVADAIAGAQADAYPVKAAQLPPNLAATLHERDGLFYTGDAPERAAAGDLRIGYRLATAAQARVEGVQTGKLIKPAREH